MTQLVFPMPEKCGDNKWLGNVHDSAAGLVISQAALQHDHPTLVITKSSDSAARLEAEIRFYAQGSTLEILAFPDWETLPYDSFSPHQDIISTRVSTLHRLSQLRHGVVVVPVSTLMHRLAPANFLHANTLLLDKGQTLDSLRLREQLINAGYRAVDTVQEHGEFAFRGAIIDLYPMGADLPYRIDLFDDEIDSLRTFTPDNQRSVEQIEQIRLLPAREFPLTSSAISAFKQRWRARFDVDPRHCPIYQDVSNGFAPLGIEYYLPLFFLESASLFDYLPANTLTISETGLPAACEHFWQEVQQRYEARRHDIERPVLPPAELFIPVDQLLGQLKAFQRLHLSDAPEPIQAGHSNLIAEPAPALTVNNQSNQPLAALTTFLASNPGRVLFCAESPGRREALLTLLSQANIQPEPVASWQAFQQQHSQCAICVFPLDRGLNLPGQIQVITESQLFGGQVFQRRRRSREKDQSELVVRSLAELVQGAPVVHIDHGVGRYLGLETIELDGQASEFLMLAYANDTKLYVPVSSLHLISRYSGSADELAPLHKLGTDQWNKARRKAAEKIRDTAAELLDIYARRAARKGFAFSEPEQDYQRFSADFPFEETPDQELAIAAVIHDMTAKQPMDRLICGDVGFGKTEVAMRAAFLAVQSGKQVALLVPTTLLAQQHYQNFSDRFADWPVRVELISRFRTAKQQSTVADQLKHGKIDILVGTHKLLQGDIHFRDLGLVIIDEEHRFGVQQKERLKSLRAEVDILTMTATPIPRTLNMAMSGMRDLSIIATPPARRLAVKTFVRESDNALVKEAILRELLRGGQVYYLHNEVKTIEKTARELAELVPEARIGIGHGQMRERQLEQVMSDFYHRRYNILLCTTIIETGIDVPNANTIIIDRADKFGLAQLHQLRGRVGRSHHQAYAYLLTPPAKTMRGDAQKRLEAIAQADDLGAGFTLATHDLEIRGAGELLGEEQSGQIQGIGFTLYMEMLEEAIRAIREGRSANLDRPLQHGAEVNLRLPALIPDDYLPDVHTRLVLYKRIANAQSEDQLQELQIEMIDRFGLLPDQVVTLFRLTALKLRIQALGIDKLDAGAQGGRLTFGDSPKVNPLTLVTLVQQQPLLYKLEGANLLRFSADLETPEQRFTFIENLLDTLGKETL